MRETKSDRDVFGRWSSANLVLKNCAATVQLSGTMQVASNPFSAPIHSHYHSYYHLHPPDHDLKRQYLALLPPQQIIEICLTFDLHVPPYVKSTIWPPDISAAIARLRPPPQPQVSTEEPSKDGEAVMDSLKSPEPLPTRQESAPATEPSPPDKERTSSPSPSTALSLPPVAGFSTPPPQPAQSISSSSSATETLQVAAPVQPTQPTPAALPAPPQPPQAVAQPQYPHQHYAYAHPQAAYPHAPYYPPHPAGYSYPYASYAAPMQNAYHPQAPPAYPPQPSMYNSMMALTHPPQHDGVLADDLPSYEEMIVEALTGCVDPEGWAPKDLFAWMASRYPLQSNFRPSASQALQKAFKRGRFEKSSNGKYRLNATWNGGNTSRRTTRRPQTQNTQSTPGSSTPAPPFTNAPLVHHNHGHASTSSHAATGQQTYQSTPYGYAYTGMAYSGFSAQPQASSSTAPGASSSSTDANDAKAAVAGSSDSDTAAAYEAAQNILNAINFGSLYQLAPEEQGEHAAKDERQADQQQAGVGSGVEELLSHVQAMLASAEAGAGAGASGPGSSSHPGPGGSVGASMMPPPPPPPDSASDPRAELQAQLALLAAQLAELAKVEDAADLQQQQQQQQQQLLPTPAAVHMPAPAPAPAPIHAPTPIAAAPSLADVSDIPEALPEEDEESDDDDMEEVI
ncbi:hypothetical protein BDZ97DRAFT_288427 [Flammula alnicola]|nr:hypothetical protein BDZ97DRAFT_288427 [Flammula alnicola]